MNYYYPFFNQIPYQGAVGRSFLGRIFGGLNFSSILSGTQKTLGIVNQTIPLIKQVSPIIKNAKTMFQVMNEFKKEDTTDSKQNVPKKTTDVNQETNTTSSYSNNPTFFL